MYYETIYGCVGTRLQTEKGVNWRGKRIFFCCPSFKRACHEYSRQLTILLLHDKGIYCFQVSSHILIYGRWPQAEGNLIQILASYAPTHGLHVLLNFLGSDPFTSTGLFSWGTKVASYLDTKSSISRNTFGCVEAKLSVSQGSTDRSNRHGFAAVTGLQGAGTVCTVHVTVDSFLSSNISSSSGMADGSRLAMASAVRLCVTADTL
jgi:hypothetical protein